MNSNPINSQTESKSWEIAYQDLLANQKKRGIHPVHDHNPDVMRKVVKEFIAIFNQIPDQSIAVKEMIATSPLFPKEMHFNENFEESRDTTRPLNYIMFAANKKALEVLSPYLKEEDWLRPGPYGSTVMHCVISGMEYNCASEGEPAACLEELIKRYPSLKNKTNSFGTTPLAYLYTVIPKLKDNLNYINRNGGGGFGGMNKCITTSDNHGGDYNESASQYEILLNEAEKIKKILQRSS